MNAILIPSLIATNLLTLAVLTWLAVRFLRQRERRTLRRSLGRNPIPAIKLAAFDPRFALSRSEAPSLDSEVRFVGSAGTLGGTSDTEAWILAVLAKSARRIFELGTCTGKTTYLLAANAPPDARVVSLTLSPEQAAALAAGRDDTAAALEAARQESRIERFYYEDLPEATKIEQLFGDSRAFDTGPHRGRYDLLFIDGSHAASYVRSDSAKALELVAPGGVIVWHDYSPAMPGVWNELNRLKDSGLALCQIERTSLVVYRAPAA